jgi:hypothetical protein
MIVSDDDGANSEDSILCFGASTRTTFASTGADACVAWCIQRARAPTAPMMYFKSAAVFGICATTAPRGHALC